MATVYIAFCSTMLLVLMPMCASMFGVDDEAKRLGLKSGDVNLDAGDTMRKDASNIKTLN
jgi:hypothetical protein